MKRTICLITVLMLFCAVLSACGESASVGDSQTEPAEQIDIAALTQKMQAAASEWPGMLSIGSGDERAQRGFEAISTLDYGKVDAFTLLYASEGESFELAVIRLKDEADIPALEQSLKKHIETRTESYRYYKPDQAARAESAVVAVHGRYAALIMSSDNAAVKAVFDQAFR